MMPTPGAVLDSAGTGGWLWLGGLVVGALVAAGCLLAARKSRPEMGPVLGALPLVTLAVAALASVALVEAGRRKVLDYLVDPDSADLWWGTLATRQEVQLGVTSMTALALLVLMPLAAAAAVRPGLKDAPPEKTALLRAMAWGAIGVGVAAAVPISLIAVRTGALSDVIREMADGSAREAALVDRLDVLSVSDGRPVAVGVAVVAGVVSVIGAVVAGRAGHRVGVGGVGLGVATLALGLTAFVATRGRAADARDRVSLVGDAMAFELSGGEFDERPIAGTCRPAPIAPVLAYTSDRVTLDSRTMSVDQLAQDLATLRRNWSILRPSEPFSGDLILLASPHSPALDIAPWLAAAGSQGYKRVWLTQRIQHVVATRTLGGVGVPGVCSVPIELAAGSVPLSGRSTLADLMRNAGAGRRRFDPAR